MNDDMRKLANACRALAEFMEHGFPLLAADVSIPALLALCATVDDHLQVVRGNQRREWADGRRK